MILANLSPIYCRSALLIRTLTSRKVTKSPKVIQKYGRDVPVNVPRLKDVVDFPQPPLHRHYEDVWRKASAWTCDLIQRQEDLCLLANWDVAYALGWGMAHCTDEEYLLATKGIITAVYVDTLYDYRWSAKEKMQFAQDCLAWMNQKKRPKQNLWFASRFEMLLQLYEEASNRWLNNQQAKEVQSMLMKSIAAELLSSDEGEHQLSIDKFIEYRTISSATNVTSFFWEPLSGFKMPEELKQSPDIKRLYQVGSCLTWMPNDYASFKNEQLRDNHWNNFITVYARQHAVDLQNGVQKLIDAMNDLVLEFQTLMHKIVESDLALNCPGLKNYLEIKLANLVYGVLQTHDVTGKYNGTTRYVDGANRNDRINPKELYSRLIL